MKIFKPISQVRSDVRMFEVVKSKWKTIGLNQYVISIIVNVCHTCTALAMCWTSPVIRELHGPNSPLSREPTMQEEEWIGSLALFGGLLGSIIVMPLWRYVGRRWIFIASNIPLLVGWALAGFATNLPMMYAARFLWGCSSGVHFAILPIYIGEIASKEIRGALGVQFAFFTNVGYFLTYAIGANTTYWQLTAIGGILTFIYVPTTFLIPETPHYLVYKGRNEEALEVLQKLRGKSGDSVQSEMEAIQEMVDNEFREPPKIQDLWATRGNVKAFGICIFLTMLQNLSGLVVILMYLEELLTKMNTALSPAQGTVVFGGFQLCSSMLTPLVADRFGRKQLMCFTTLGLTISLGILGFYELLDTYCKYDVSSFTFVPLTCLIVFVVMFMLGVGPVPWVLVSEMFRVKTKSIVSGICSFMTFAAGFIWVRYFNEVAASVGIYTGFWILALCCFIGFIISATVLKETKGKTFEEIQDILNDRNKEPIVDTSNKDGSKFAF